MPIEAADTPTESTKTPEKTNKGRTRSVAQKGAVNTSEERTDQPSTDLNGADATTPQPKKTSTRKRTKAVSAAGEPATNSVPEAAEPAAQKKPATRQRKKAAELVVSDAETASTPKPVRTTARTRQVKAKSTAATPNAPELGSEPQTTTAEQHTETVEPVTQAAEIEAAEAPVAPAASPAEALATTAASSEPVASAPEIVETSAPIETNLSISEQPAAATRSTDEAQEPASPVEHETSSASSEVQESVATAESVASEEVADPTESVVGEEASDQAEQEEIDSFVEVIPAVEDAAAIPTGIVEKSPVVLEETSQASSKAERGHLVRSAALVSIGNLGSSLLGMVRQIAVTGLGPSIAGPFNAALSPVNNFYQLLVNGSTDGALIPVFNEYAAPEKKEEGRRVIFTVVNLVLIISVIASIGYVFLAPSFVNILVSGYAGADRTLTLHFSQVIFFSMVVLGPFAVLLAALFSLKVFGWPAFATAAYHAGIILGALVATVIGLQTLGIIALPIGLLIGAAGQIVLLLPGIRQHKLYYILAFDFKHPALKRIYRLYWPIAVSYIFSTALVFLDLYLQSWTPQKTAGTTAMAAATTLIQFPIGLVAQALSIAVLPTLSEHARANNTERFKETLQLGIRLGLLLMIPAMTGLLVLRTPIIYLIFAHHNYTISDANIGAVVLQNYAYQLPFVVVDQLLIAAFYARKNTLTPVLVGIASMAFYMLVAFPTYSTIGVAGLAFANTVQNSSHAIILLIILRIWIGPLHVRRTIPSVLKICISAVAMGFVAWLAMDLLSNVSIFSLSHTLGRFLTFIVAGGLASVIYFAAIWLFKVEEIGLIKGIVRTKLGRK